MDLSLQILISWQFVIFSLGIAAFTYIARTSVEFLLSLKPTINNKLKKVWNELLLPVGPVIGGLVLGLLLKQYPYPEGISSDSARGFFGLVAGLFSGLAYKIIKGLFLKKAEELQSSSIEDLANKVKDSIKE